MSDPINVQPVSETVPPVTEVSTKLMLRRGQSTKSGVLDVAQLVFFTDKMVPVVGNGTSVPIIVATETAEQMLTNKVYGEYIPVSTGPQGRYYVNYPVVFTMPTVKRGFSLVFEAHVSCLDYPVVYVNEQGPFNLQKNSQDMIAGDIQMGHFVVAKFDGSAFQVISSGFGSGGGSSVMEDGTTNESGTTSLIASRDPEDSKLRIKQLRGSGGIDLTDQDNVVTFYTNVAGRNLGAGLQVYTGAEDGQNLKFRTLVIKGNAVVTETVNEITIDIGATEGGSTDPGTRNALPSGAIIDWWGDINNIPEGFVLCDGRNGTPNILGRVTVGAGGEYNPGQTGGDTVFSLSMTTGPTTLTTSQIPAHNHITTLGADSANSDRFIFGTYGSSNLIGTVSVDFNNVWPMTSFVGGGGSHTHPVTASSGDAEVMPPYIALLKIMKI